MKTYTLHNITEMEYITISYWNLFFFTHDWMIYEGNKTKQQIRLMPDGTIILNPGDKEVIGHWEALPDYVFKFTYQGEIHTLTLSSVDQNIMTFRNENTNKYLILIEPNFMKHFGIHTAQQIDAQIKSPTNETFYTPRETFYIINNPDPDTDIYTEEDEDQLPYDSNEEFDEYEGFTKEEIIYDYLQREQDEEDDYLDTLDDE